MFIRFTARDQNDPPAAEYSGLPVAHRNTRLLEQEYLGQGMNEIIGQLAYVDVQYLALL